MDRVIELGMIARSNESYRLKTFMESVLRVKFQHDRPFIKDIRHYFIVNQSSNLIRKVKALLGKSGELKESFDSDKTEED